MHHGRRPDDADIKRLDGADPARRGLLVDERLEGDSLANPGDAPQDRAQAHLPASGFGFLQALLLTVQITQWLWITYLS